MRPLSTEDTEQFARRITEIAWSNGAYCAVETAIKERDEARREWCYMESCRRIEYGMEPADEPSIAAERGWDCYRKNDEGEVTA
jgi:hypothetical protein